MKSPFIHLVVAGAICVFTMAGYGVWYATLGAKSVAVANLEAQIVTKTDTMARIASARASLAEIAGDEASMQSYFVPETGVVPFINSLEAQGVTQGSTVSVLSVAKGGGAGTPTSFLFTVTIKGTFDAVMRTLGAIEYAPYNLSIATLSIGNDDKNSWHADLTLSVGSITATATSTTP